MLKYLCKGFFLLKKSNIPEKLTRKLSIFIFVFLITSQLIANDNKVTFNFRNTPLKTVVSQIEKQTDYLFVYDEQAIDINQKVNINAQNSSVEEILKSVLNGTNITYSIEGKNIVLRKKQKAEQDASQSTSANRRITGTVTDNKGEPIIGATVVDPRTKNGTITDYKGNFSLDVSDNTVLQVSYIGYAPAEIKVGSQQKLNVQLSEGVLALDEVVVVGYGTQRKINVTGSIAQISAKELEDRPVANLSQMLQGAIPNLNVNFSSGRPGSTGALNIRGNTSLTGAGPLVLIDGIEGDLNRINPNDVENVTILKDASASAIYGARASYGVILVSTKKGEKGKMNITYNGRYSVSAPTASVDYETRGYDAAKIINQFYKSYAGVDYIKYTEADYEQLYLRRNDKVEHPDRPWTIIDQRDGRDTYVYYANFDFYNWMFDTSRPTHEHNLNISGGNEKIQYSLSGNFFNQKGMIRDNPDIFERYSFRSSITTQVKPWLNIKNTTRYYRQSYYFPGWSSVNDLFINASNSAFPNLMPYNPDGSWVYTNSLLNNGRYAEGRHIIARDGLHNNYDNWDDFATTFEATLNLTKHFEVVANYSYSKVLYQTLKRTDKLIYSHYPDEIRERTDDIGISRNRQSDSNRWYHATNVWGVYSNSFGNHNLKITAGANYETLLIKDLSTMREGLLSLKLTDFNLATGKNSEISGGQNSYAIMGAFYRVNYDFSGRYLFEFSGRYDGSSRFKQGHRFGFFPSGSVGWRVSEEKFFKPLQSYVNDLKIRGSYGVLGNQQNVGYYDYMQTINTGNTMNYSLGDGSRVQYASISSPNSETLTWEKVYTSNIGVDFLFFKQRLSFSADIYRRETKGMLTKGLTLPSAYGAAPPKLNAANLQTDGWEVALSWKDSFHLGGKPFSYSVGAGVSDYKAVITKFDNPTKLLTDYYVGQRIGDIWGFSIDGYFLSDEEAANYPTNQESVNSIINGSAGTERGLKAGDLKFLDLDGDNTITLGQNTADKPGDRTIIGNSQPRFAFGFNMSASWNGIDVAAFFQGIGKQDWYPANNNQIFWGPYARPTSSFIPKDFMKDVWSPENPNAYFPRPRGYVAFAGAGGARELTSINNKYLQDLAYVRLKNLTIGYSLPRKVLPKNVLENVRFYFSGENLLTATKLHSKYVDPEEAAANPTNSGVINSSGTTSSSAIAMYPWAKTFSFGIDVKF
jgi:TonB-linked SusC/RagA family outer membrane protein